MLALMLLLAGAPGAGTDLEKPPLTVPLFDGIERGYKPPSTPLKRPEIPDFWRLFELTVACGPKSRDFGTNYTSKAASRTKKPPKTAL
ncbi:hypothetical protein [Pseudoduganella ginsengisoli]|uniref:Uncharacterized protein n=1 Tax=Pseudoduganella ginsengisoli TaxID=1462440 RepID=A0A6L6Q9K9_9BURK|nr:hypothetical protein [Pseudoduganella ginsengisoli]MTW06325.1 hypothetical protein [Pseudoduganella ginsengisoli]